MPSRYPSKYRKKRRRRRRYDKSMTRYTGPGLTRNYPLGKKFFTKTRYCAVEVEINAGLGTPASHVFNLMGLYDPDITGIGHQPIAFDQMMLLYNHYYVIGSRARVTATAWDTVQSTDLILHVKDQAATSSDIEQIIENGQCRWGRLGRSGSGQESKTLTLNFSPKTYFGRKIFGETAFRGDSGSNPSESAYLHITCMGTGGTDTNVIRCTVQLEFLVIYTEPKELAKS